MSDGAGKGDKRRQTYKIVNEEMLFVKEVYKLIPKGHCYLCMNRVYKLKITYSRDITRKIEVCDDCEPKLYE